MPSTPHILINALSATGAGGVTVARGLTAALAGARPKWMFVQLAQQNAGFEAAQRDNVQVIEAPPEATGRLSRQRWQSATLPQIAAQRAVGLTIQLNGMLAPGLGHLPHLCHNQDPWPYRPQAWDLGWRDRVLAMLRRRAHAKALRTATTVGFTSNYLRDLMTSSLKISPQRSNVFYNGLPEESIDRATKLDSLKPWNDRPMEILSVSAVAKYKRQELVIRALPQLIRRSGCANVIYRVIGKMTTLGYESHLKKLVSELSLTDRVIFEGHATEARVQEAFATARCFVLMSVCESFGIPAIEAMSFGTPVVTSDCCAMPEVCGDAAILSPVDDVDALTENLYRVLTDLPLAEQLRTAGAANCSRFRWCNTAEAMAKEIEALLA